MSKPKAGRKDRTNTAPKGLAGKLIRFIVIFVLVMGAVFFLIPQIQLFFLNGVLKAEEEEQVGLVKRITSEAVSNLAKDSLRQMVTWASDKVDDEFWILDHDIRVLQHQVEDVLRNPGKYETLPVEPPKKENQGSFCLQVLAPGDYDEISEETMVTLGKLANLAPMMEEMVRGNEGYTLDAYIALPNGVSLSMDASSGEKYDENGKIIPYDATTREWFREAVKEGDRVLLAAHSHFYDFNEAIFGIPVYVDGKLSAVLEMSMRLEVLERKLSERNIGESGFSVLVSDKGQLVCSSREEGELRNREDISGDIRDSLNPELSKVVDAALGGEYGVSITEVDGKTYYVGYAPLLTINWVELAFASAEELHAPAGELEGEMNRSSSHMLSVLENAFRNATLITLLVIVLITQAAIIMVSTLAKRRVRPLNRMSERMKAFTGEDMDFQMEEMYKTGDEIQVLAESFETMSVKMKSYIKEIVAMSTEKERIDAEMKLASQIQKSMLPAKFPAFPDRKEFDLYANMVPAKNVGGDFYDFFLVDDDHLALVMADVSGKGIAAALFMALSKQVIQSSLLLSGGDVESAIKAANLQLIEESVSDMFVTVWLGVVTLSTGELTFVDAGHEYPAIRRGEGAFTIEVDQHSMPVAALTFAKYRINKILLKPGDMLFLYTDGVPEAHNTASEMFGMDRLALALNEEKDASMKELDDLLRGKVAEFSGDEEPWDDITTLFFRYLGPGKTD